jgi:hypothetical protein
MAAYNEVAEQVNVIVPRDPQEFYVDFGFLTHPRLKDENGQPMIVEKLAPYQHEFWSYQSNTLAIKSQKIGLTTTSLMEDFQFTLLPEGAGKDVLVIAQNQLLADDHILTLKRMIYQSKKYSQFLVTTPDAFREEKTKMSVIYVKNPYNNDKPSRIIALGKSEASVWSWKNVGKIHMSDVAKLDIKEQKNFFAAVYSRLANTQGIIKIETPPNGQQGEVYNIYNKSRAKVIEDYSAALNTFADDPADNASKFKIFEYPAIEAVKAGIISREFLEQERNELGDLLFSQLYECNFLPPGNQWYNESMIYTEDYEVEF